MVPKYFVIYSFYNVVNLTLSFKSGRRRNLSSEKKAAPRIADHSSNWSPRMHVQAARFSVTELVFG